MSLLRFTICAGLMLGTGALSSADGPDASASSVVSSVPADGWSTLLPEFKPDAPLDGAPTILYFTATWCGYCGQMERTTLVNTSVRSWLEPFGQVKLDYDQQSEWVNRYRIRGVPAFVMVNARGEEITRLVGMTEADPFRGWLAEGRTKAADMVVRAEQRRAELTTLATLLASQDEAGWAGAMPRLYDLAARGDPELRAFALERLAERAKAKSAALHDGLQHPDLAVRLVVAGVLKKQLGERFVFDPWEEEAARAEAIKRLRLTREISAGSEAD